MTHKGGLVNDRDGNKSGTSIQDGTGILKPEPGRGPKWVKIQNSWVSETGTGFGMARNPEFQGIRNRDGIPGRSLQ